MNKRLLRPEDIPSALWDAHHDSVCFGPALTGAYRQTLENNDLLTRAITAEPQGSVGGISNKAAEEHFISAFCGSCARVRLAVLDPNLELGNASNLLVNALSGGRLALLDIPCGAAAASASLLSAIAELRSCKAIPRQPLEVFLVGGELSDRARQLGSELIGTLKENLEPQGIFVYESFVKWDVCDSISNTSLINHWEEHAKDCSHHLVIVANCSGFLHLDKKFEEAQPQFEEIFRWTACRSSTVIWIEPQTNIAKGMLERFRKTYQFLLRKLFGWFQPTSLETSARFTHPIQTEYPRVNLSLLRLQENKD
jgi:hypothetical protein